MKRTCGNCTHCDIPDRSVLESAGMVFNNIGYCRDAGEFVCLSDMAEDCGCEDIWEER